LTSINGRIVTEDQLSDSLYQVHVNKRQNVVFIKCYQNNPVPGQYDQ
jgi:hypothetical protein